MSMNIESEANRSGGTDIAAPHVIALIRERERRLAAIRRYDRYITQAVGRLPLQDFWRNLRRQDEDNLQRMQNWLDQEQEAAGRA